jgi:ATP-binding protein involved in chromosome partitioning
MYGRLGVPVLGMVENMAYYIAPGQTEKVDLFPRGQLDHFLDEKNIEKLTEIPFDTKIGLGCEAGVPLMESQKIGFVSQAFTELATKILAKTNSLAVSESAPPPLS